jgi:peptidoglycan/xylan/chitin deacetylase (PgdA/CDA1 family)
MVAMDKIIVTTSWDDGHLLDLKLATLLKKYALKGTFYVSPKNREFASKDLLSDTEIKELSSDFEIGAHTMTHPRLSTLSVIDAYKEIIESKRYVEQVVGKPVVSFCYPGGDYTKKNVEQVREAGFRLGRTVRRFFFGPIKNPFETGTSVHAYNHWSDVWDIAVFSHFHPLRFWRYYRHWDELAKAMFDRIAISGGIFHLWGHSWEIEKNHHWSALENVFRHISRRTGVAYRTNGELV